MLYELGLNKFSKSEGVKNAISSLDQVLNDELESFELSSGDWCVVNVIKNTSIIKNNFDEFEPVEINTIEIYSLMKEWYEFLSAYENGKIPGIIHPNKRGSF